MSLPDDERSSIAIFSDPLAPDDRLRTSLLVDYELGGTALNDPSQGLRVRNWMAFYADGQIQVRPEGGTPTTAVISDPDVTELSLTFDQNMRPTIAYTTGGSVKLYWYDSLIESVATLELPAGCSAPFVCLDDKRITSTLVGRSDGLFFYVRDGLVCYRQQRDRYEIERVLAPLPENTVRFSRVGMGTNLRLQIETRD